MPRAAIVGVWSSLPRDTQRAIFEYAGPQQAYDPAELRRQIAQFLHDHNEQAAGGGLPSPSAVLNADTLTEEIDQEYAGRRRSAIDRAGIAENV